MSQKGRLVVSTFLAGETIPVPDALVTVTQKNKDKNILVGIRKTDSNGKTTPIEIETPDVEYSLTPDNNGVIPFSSVDVRVDHPATYTQITENVQIFPNEISVENVSLIPLKDNVKEDEREEITIITPQEL